MRKRDATTALIEQRAKTHGDYVETARVAVGIEAVFAASPNWCRLRPFQRHALQEIAHKAARILCGDPDFVDHWDDVAGYAKRVAQCIGEKK